MSAPGQGQSQRAAELGTRRGVPAEALNQLIQGVDDPGSFADLVAFYLELPTPDKQALLETLDDEEVERRKPQTTGDGPLVEREDDGTWRVLPIVVEGAAREW